MSQTESQLTRALAILRDVLAQLEERYDCGSDADVPNFEGRIGPQVERAIALLRRYSAELESAPPPVLLDGFLPGWPL